MLSGLFEKSDAGKLTSRMSDKIKEALKTTGKDSEATVNIVSFQLLNRYQIAKEFLNFYRFDSVQQIPPDLIDNREVGTEADDEMPRLRIRSGPTVGSLLEEQAYTFSVILTDSYGRGNISLYELKTFLSLAKNTNPKDALANVEMLLVDPVRPDPPPPSPEPPRAEWVYEWLATGFEKELAIKFGDSFVDQRMCTRDDLRNGALLDAATLTTLDITKLGDQRKIIFMHSELMKAMF
jgi:hypothetical protein